MRMGMLAFGSSRHLQTHQHASAHQVMRESATLAMTWLKGQMMTLNDQQGGGGGSTALERLVGRPLALLDASTDVHLHVPAGAIPKVGAVHGEWWI